MEAALSWALGEISHYGYAAVFVLLMLGIVGLPIPDETILVFCGYLIGRGQMSPEGAFFAALAGSWCGISLSYWIGRTFGLGVVHRFGKYLHLNDERLAKVHAWFDRIGHWALFVGYYIVGVRHFTAIIAGTSKLGFGSFMLYAWSGGLLWVSTFLTIGYFLGENWKQVAELVHRDLALISAGIAVVVAVVWLVRRRRRS